MARAVKGTFYSLLYPKAPYLESEQQPGSPGCTTVIVQAVSVFPVFAGSLLGPGFRLLS